MRNYGRSIAWRDIESLKYFKPYFHQDFTKGHILPWRIGIKTGNTFTAKINYRIPNDLKKILDEINKNWILPYT